MPAELSPVGAVPESTWGSYHETERDSFYNNQHTSVLVQIAPFMGLGDLLDNVDPFFLDFENDLTDQDVYDGIDDLWFGYLWTDPLNIDLNGNGARNLIVDIAAFTCPTDNVNQVPAHGLGQVLAVYSIDPNTEDLPRYVAWLAAEGDGRYTGTRTNYVGCFGACTGGDNRGGELGPFRGAIGHREVRTLDSISDGLSNTIFFGENIGTIQWRLDTGAFDRNFTRLWYMGANSIGRGGIRWQQQPPHNTMSGFSGFWYVMSAANPDYPDPQTEPDPRQGILGSAFHARHHGFGSMHPDGVNFAMLDGSVRKIARTDDWQTLYALFGAFDGFPDPQAPSVR